MKTLIVFKNAFANVVRISTSALIALLLPPFLVRMLSSEIYNTWALVLQLSAYVAFLDFGIQTAIGRFVARTTELDDQEQRDRIVNTALMFLVVSSAIGLLLILVIVWQLPNMFRDMPTALHHDARLALLLIGGSLAIGLPGSAFNGVFIGLQRNEVPMVIMVGNKILSAILIVVIVYNGGDLVQMALSVAGINLGSSLLQYLACRILVADVHISAKFVSKQAAKEIFDYCLGLSVWSFGMLLVSGIDTTVVGFVDFQAIAGYAIVLLLTNFIIQFQSAIFSTLIPLAAVLGVHGDSQRLGRLLISSTRYGMIILLLLGLPLIIGAKLILTIWVGATYASQTTLLLQVLVAANIVRLSGLPYATLLVGTGQQHLVLLSPLVEGFVNFLVSIVAGLVWGAVGVAIGTLVGSFASIGFHIFYNMPRTTSIAVSKITFFCEGILRPIVCAIPIIVLALVLPFLPQLQVIGLMILISSIFIVTLLLFWQWGLETYERQQVLSLISRA